MTEELKPREKAWPPPFYFNDLELPPWTARWSACRLDEIAGCDGVDPDGFHDHEKAAERAERWRIECIIDHVGVVESEDPLVFQVSAMDVLFDLLANRAAAIEAVANRNETDLSPAEIYSRISDGLVRMIHSAHRSGRAFWTSGGPEDRRRLLETITLCQPSWQLRKEAAPPHECERRSNLATRAWWQLKRLRKLGHAGLLEKHERRWIAELPEFNPWASP